MKVGVLQTGLVPDGFSDAHGEYDVAFRRLLHRIDPSIEVEGWRVVEREMPPAPDAADGWIISGSKHGVYEDHPWIDPLKDFIRHAAKARSPMIGVCFGHQIIAEALGGRAEKWKDGWRLGSEDYRVLRRPSWMADAPETLKICAVHQDQVTALAPDATLLASSDGCENAMIAYGDVEAPYAISLQPHPEFSDAYARELLEVRRGAVFPVAATDEALGRLASGEVMDVDWATETFIRFLRLGLPKMQAIASA
ncbi:MAG: type 1 glutamine amidotransferase [Pseudomonadota bacterium]